MAAQAKTIHATGVAECERVLAALRRQAPKLRGLGITRLRLFGSMARGETRPNSDVDLLVELDPESHFSLFELVGLQDDLQALLGPAGAYRIRFKAAPVAARRDPPRGDPDLLMRRGRGLRLRLEHPSRASPGSGT